MKHIITIALVISCTAIGMDTIRQASRESLLIKQLHDIVNSGTFDEFKKYQAAFQKELHYNTIIEKFDTCASHLKAIDAKEGSAEHLAAEKHRLMSIQQGLQDILDAEWIPPGKLEYVKKNDNYRFKCAQRKQHKIIEN